MANPRQHRNWILGNRLRAATAPLALAIVLVLTPVVTQSAQAQTFNVIHNFTGGQDGANPLAGLTIDRGGNLYGTAYRGGAGYGTVYKLAHKGSGWTFNPLYAFAGGSDGAHPYGRVIFGGNGTLYGTTSEGGNSSCSGGCGTVFNLKPPATACKSALCPWTEIVLYRFTGTDGAGPSGDLIFDQAGSLYGTTYVGGGMGGPDGAGVVYKLTAAGVESTLYIFPETGCTDGADPVGAGVVFDNMGNLYGTTRSTGAYGCGNGVVFQLSPSGSGWIENVLYTFQNGSDGGLPFAGLIKDQLGNLYGATSSGSQGGGGTVFEMMPPGNSWKFSALYGFSGTGGPQGNLIMDQAGNLYGTTTNDGKFGQGSVFKLTPSGGDWTETDLYSFTGGSDVANPYSNIVFDANGNLYGTASAGGTSNDGVVWEITP